MLLHGSAGVAALIATLMMTSRRRPSMTPNIRTGRANGRACPCLAIPASRRTIRESRPGRGQGAPLTPEYQAVFEANLADQKAGGQGGEAAT